MNNSVTLITLGVTLSTQILGFRGPLLGLQQLPAKPALQWNFVSLPSLCPRRAYRGATKDAGKGAPLYKGASHGPGPVRSSDAASGKKSLFCTSLKSSGKVIGPSRAAANGRLQIYARIGVCGRTTTDAGSAGVLESVGAEKKPLRQRGRHS